MVDSPVQALEAPLGEREAKWTALGVRGGGWGGAALFYNVGREWAGGSGATLLICIF